METIHKLLLITLHPELGNMAMSPSSLRDSHRMTALREGVAVRGLREGEDGERGRDGQVWNLD